MKIGIYAGSFKPPHSGHFHLVENAIKKDKIDKMVIIISSKPRYLDSYVQKPEKYSKIELEKHFQKDFLTKSQYIQFIKNEKLKGNLPLINAKMSKEIWTIYLDYFVKKKLLKDYEIRISALFSPMMNTNVYLKKSLKHNNKNIYFLYKSSKDEENSRFDFILKKYNKSYVISKTIPIKIQMNATVFRNYIFHKKNILSFLPKKLSKENILSIKKVLQ